MNLTLRRVNLTISDINVGIKMFPSVLSVIMERKTLRAVSEHKLSKKPA